MKWTETEQPPNKAGTRADARKRREETERLLVWDRIVEENAKVLGQIGPE